MIRFGSLLALAVAAVFILQGCNKNKEDCPFLAPQVVFVGFQEAERDTMVIRKYEANNMFNVLIDTIMISKADIIATALGQDSIGLSTNRYTDLNTKFFAYNWEIYLPGANNTTRISEVTPTFTKERETSAQCQSYASAVTVNGVMYHFTGWFDTPYRVYSVR
jgi:hypothetical protein